jgi:thiol-disulfide isomerase/thioredoxin
MSNYKSYNELPTSSLYQFDGPPCHKVLNIPEKKKLIGTHRICIFKIGAQWCGPCRKIAPYYDEMAHHMNRPGELFLAREDFDDGLSANVHSVPAFDYYFEGRKVHRQTGADLEELKKNISIMMERNRNQ